MARPSRKRTLLLIVGLLLAGLVVAAFVSTDGLRAFGDAPGEAALARMRSLPYFRADHFENLEPTTVMMEGAMWPSAVAWATGREMRAPVCPLPIAPDTRARLAETSSTGLRVTWFGHSSTLLEIDGARVLTDPMWSDRSSPSRWAGPRRFHPPPMALEDLPPVDAAVISHEHYDHLDMNTVRALAARGVRFHVPLGAAAHLATWSVPEAQIVELAWWESATLPGGLRIVSTPARHFNGRGVPGRIGALWSSWVIAGPRHRVYYSGDTGFTESFREIARREGPFDLSLLEVGQYHPHWGQIHLGPTGALDAHQALGAKVLLPVHWATFQLAYHAWSEPAESLFVQAAERGVELRVPRLGEVFEPLGARTATTPWWRGLPPLSPRCP